MVRSFRVGVAVGCAVLALATGRASVGQDTTETKTTTERIKEKAGSAVGSVKKGVGSAGEAIKNKYNQAKDHIAAMGIEARVYSRLHWEKSLADAKIELSAPRAGVIVLTGNLSDPKARAKAVMLTNDTIGVTEVVDHLTVTTAPDPNEVK